MAAQLTEPARYILERAKSAAAAGISEGEFYATFTDKVLADSPRRIDSIWQALQDAQNSGEWPWVVWSRFVFPSD